VHDVAVFITQAEHVSSLDSQKAKDDMSKSQLPYLTKEKVHDGAAFFDQAEKQQFSAVNSQKDKAGSDLPNLSTKDVHDGATFMDSVENLGQNV